MFFIAKWKQSEERLSSQQSSRFSIYILRIGRHLANIRGEHPATVSSTNTCSETCHVIYTSSSINHSKYIGSYQSHTLTCSVFIVILYSPFGTDLLQNLWRTHCSPHSNFHLESRGTANHFMPCCHGNVDFPSIRHLFLFLVNGCKYINIYIIKL
jgi:hypothetical protein